MSTEGFLVKIQLPIGEDIYRLRAKELLCNYLIVSWRPWYVASWEKKTLSEFAGSDLFLSSNPDVCPSAAPPQLVNALM